MLRRVDNAGSAHFTYVDGNPLASTNAAGNFDNDYNYTPVNERYPGASPGSYVVSSGDTLRAIALAVYGDARLWFLIAQANGLSSDADLRAGQTLNVPNRVTNLYASAQTVRPYSPGEIVGDTTPTLPDPPPPPPPPQGRGGCGGFGQVLVMVVSIAVAAAMPAVAPALQGITGTLVGAAVGNVAGQVVGNIAGVQKGFNFRSLAMSVASAGIGYGISGGGAPGAKSLADRLLPGSLATGFAGAAFNAAAGSLLGQGAAILVGAQQRFDWRAVAAAAVGGAAGSALGSALGETSMARVGEQVGRNIVSQAVANRGRVNFAQVAGDVFGNMLGNALAAQFARTEQQGIRLRESQVQAFGPQFAGANMSLDTDQQSAGTGINGSANGGRLFDSATAAWRPSWAADQEAAERTMSELSAGETVQAIHRRDELANFVDRVNSFVDEQSRPVLVASNGSPSLGRRILSSEPLQKLRELALGLSNGLDAGRGIAVGKYNEGIAAIRDLAVDFAASDPTTIKTLAAHLATTANDWLGRDGPLNAAEILATPVATASGMVRAAANATEIPDLLDRLGDIKGDRSPSNPLVRTVLGEAVQMGLRVEQAGQGVLASYLRRTGRLLEGIGTGAGAELAVKAVFHASRLFSEVTLGDFSPAGEKIFDLKNSSDNGIDILVREKDSLRYVGFEVKASVTDAPPRLRGLQADGPNAFIGTRLEDIRDERGVFKGARVAPEARAYARSILETQGTFSGFVVDVTNYSKPSVNVKIREWNSVPTRIRK